jgi:hypothetical protein
VIVSLQLAKLLNLTLCPGYHSLASTQRSSQAQQHKHATTGNLIGLYHNQQEQI